MLRQKRFFDWKLPYFSPSSSNSCQRELFEKVRKSPRDEATVQPHQRRWQAIGTAIGDVIQREILLAERHYEKLVGSPPRFRFARNEQGYPFFEDFVKEMKIIMHNGKRFSLFGTCDGVMEYISEDGEVIRVGLEIKSKQTTAAQTSDYSMREPKEDHVKQCVTYSLMYDVDYYVILYVNASKKSWNMSDDEYVKNPDFKAFGIAITDEMRTEVLDYFADVLVAVDENKPPKVDLNKWNFNGFKTTIAKSLTTEEFLEIKSKVQQVLKSNVPQYVKSGYRNAYEFIEGVREYDGNE